MLTSTGHLLSMVGERPGFVLSGETLRLVFYWGAGCLLVPRCGSFGACLAAVGAKAVAALWPTFLTRRKVPYQVWGWMRVVGIGFLFVPLWLLSRGGWSAVGLFALAGAGYAGSLFALRIVSWAEVRQAWEALRATAPASNGQGI